MYKERKKRISHLLYTDQKATSPHLSIGDGDMLEPGSCFAVSNFKRKEN